jgi:hypothetical protein
MGKQINNSRLLFQQTQLSLMALSEQSEAMKDFAWIHVKD